jgi:hypothetical protein
MSVEILDAEDGMSVLELKSADRLTLLRLGLNFAEERLQLDLLSSLSSIDDSSALAARSYSDVWRFRVDYFLNGVLQVWNAEENAMLGRCDAFIPQNVDMMATVREWRRIIEGANEEANRRASAEVLATPGEQKSPLEDPPATPSVSLSDTK